MGLIKFIGRFTEGNSFRDKIVILAHNLLYLLLYPVNHLSFIIMKKNIVHPRALFKTFTVKNSDGLFICRDNVDHDIVSESFESNIRSYFKDVRKGVFIDIGANIGKYTVMVGNQLDKNGSVVAIEAHPGNFKILQENIELNNCKNITAVNVACWDKKGTLKLYSHEDQPLLSSAIKKSESYITVKSESLDEILEQLEIKEIDMIKLDVEGAEPEVLKGMSNSLKTCRPKIIFEVLNDESLDACRKILGTYNYKIKQLDKTYWLGFGT